MIDELKAIVDDREWSKKMSRYIDADELLELYNTNDLKKDVDWMVPIEVVKQNIKDMPSADVEPVRHGEWMKAADDGVWRYTDAYAECDQCHMVVFNGWSMNYCPICGARMDGESDG